MKPCLPSATSGVVLDVLGAGVALDRLARPALVEHEVVKGDHVLFVALDSVH
jgi:hypothetical protein